jgi:V/A-type H+-transporting ATPase subunit D
MADREIIPTQSAYLELKAERAGMDEGYRFLDEKRLILASEILVMLREYEQTMQRWGAAYGEARTAVRAALGRHGLEGLSVYPPAAPADCTKAPGTRSVLGVRVEEPPAVDEPEPGPVAEAAFNRSPEAEHCRRCFLRLPPLAARLAVITGNLERLRREYLRTARRARALEDVLLPEIDSTLRVVDSALEELEREEAIRVRRAGR